MLFVALYQSHLVFCSFKATVNDLFDPMIMYIGLCLYSFPLFLKF